MKHPARVNEYDVILCDEAGLARVLGKAEEGLLNRALVHHAVATCHPMHGAHESRREVPRDGATLDVQQAFVAERRASGVGAREQGGAEALRAAARERRRRELCRCRRAAIEDCTAKRKDVKMLLEGIVCLGDLVLVAARLLAVELRLAQQPLRRVERRQKRARTLGRWLNAQPSRRDLCGEESDPTRHVLAALDAVREGALVDRRLAVHVAKVHQRRLIIFFTEPGESRQCKVGWRHGKGTGSNRETRAPPRAP